MSKWDDLKKYLDSILEADPPYEDANAYKKIRKHMREIELLQTGHDARQEYWDELRKHIIKYPIGYQEEKE